MVDTSTELSENWALKAGHNAGRTTGVDGYAPYSLIADR